MKRLSKKNLRDEKDGSGIYKIYDRNRNLVYIGRSCSGDIKHNLIQHFRSPSYTGYKAGKRYDNYYDIDLMPKGKIRKRERRMIRRNKPRGNKYRYG